MEERKTKRDSESVPVTVRTRSKTQAKQSPLSRKGLRESPLSRNGLRESSEPPRLAWSPMPLGVRKTYKMFVGGAFVRSESGRYFQVGDAMGKDQGKTVDSDLGRARDCANIPLGSRKDGRDAVLAAHAAWGGWSKRTATNRGQILYRLAEMMEARSAELTDILTRGGAGGADPRREVQASIDRVIAYAGWTDKYQSLLSSSNPVAGPHFNFSVTESMGVVVIAAPEEPALLGLVGAMLPIITSGNTCIVVASERDPRTALVLAEALATSDLPGGVVNILTGKKAEILPPLAKHMEVAALDLHGLAPALSKELSVAGADSVKRVRVRSLSRAEWFAEEQTTSLGWIERFVETKTIWHPSGA